jgi:transketolase
MTLEETMEHKELKIIANNIRKHVLNMVYSANSGHIGGSFSGAELIAALYFKEANITKENVADLERDKFVLSKGHASPLLYGVLVEKGIIPVEELPTFRKVDSRLQGHPSMTYIKGVDMSTGSLGQGISAAVGMALSYKAKDKSFRVYTLVGDGESQEGQVWEAAMAAAHYKLDNLCLMLDFNGLQIDGDITKVMNPNPLDKKFEAFGWHVINIDGHDFDQILAAFKEARETKGQPTAIIAHTVKGKGVDFMENNYGWHGVAPNQEQYERAMAQLNEVNHG